METKLILDKNIEINQIKELIKQKKYDKCLDILEKAIIEYIVNLIKQEKNDFEYTTIFDLIEASDRYIKDERKNIASQIRIYSAQIEDIDNIYRLLGICEDYKITKKRVF